jgi:HSP20 family protein
LKPDPLRELLELQDRMNRLIEVALRREGLGDEAAFSSSWTPVVDVYDTGEGFLLEVELPGIDPADVEVRVQGGELSLKGRRRVNARVHPERFHRMERRHGPFTRTFPLPADVDPERLSMRWLDGLLCLDVPKARAEPPPATSPDDSRGHARRASE